MVAAVQTVLVVDDEPNIRAFLVDALQSEGFDVAEADDGAQAIRLLEQHRPPPDRLCMVLLDMMMPRVDGGAVLRYLATLDSYVPVIAMSASRQALVDAQDAGAQETLLKPFDLDRLLTIVARNCPQ